MKDDTASNPPPAGDLQRLMAMALQHHRSGRLPDAERIYRQILAADRNHAEALRAFGLLATQVGRAASAITLLRKSVQLEPGNANGHNNLGEALRATGQFAEAEKSYRQALKLQPNFPEAHNNLGIALAQQNQPAAAIESFRRAIELRPKYLKALINLGNALLQAGEGPPAAQAFAAALQIEPRHPAGLGGLASALHLLGRFDEALKACDLALRMSRNDPDLHQAKARLLRDLGRIDETIAEYRIAIALSPRDAFAHNNLGEALRSSGHFFEAAAEYRKAIGIDPNLSEAYGNLGAALGASGDHSAALDALKKAIALKPSNHNAHSNLLMEMNWVRTDQQIVFDEHVRWGEVHAAPLRPPAPPAMRNRAGGRKLRIGYVSPDLRHHPVAHFLEPILGHHDRQQFEIFCYSDAPAPDETTARLRGYADTWREIARLRDEKAGQIIRDDQIDILVDLAGHTARNRLLVFARRPAAVQVSYIGYPNTTGLREMNYRLTDALCDPPGGTERFHTEKLVRLPGAFACYRPPDDAPDVAPPPSSDDGFITFGSFNNLAKISEEAMDTWATILAHVDNSRLMLKAIGLGEKETRDRFRSALASHGVAPQRVMLAPPERSYPIHLARYGEIDIALDTFPYNGTTTTCEAMWMGVPVVALAGNIHASRVGVSLLTARGFADLVAQNIDDYIRIAADLANDVPRITSIRASAREQMKASPLLDAPRFTRNIEDAFRAIAFESSASP